MPGNKSSGRKKKIVTDDQPPITPLPKKKVGRPKKEVTLKSSEQTFLQQNELQSDTISTSQSCTGSHTQVSRQTEHRALQVYDLKKRMSDTSIFYDSYIGPAVDKFSSTKLPVQRIVLQRYRSLLISEDNPTRNEMTTTLTKEITLLWELACIPTKNYRGCWDIVQKCIINWVNAKSEVKKSDTFQSQLDTLLDLRPVSCSSLSTLQEYLKNSGNSEWEIDYIFFKGQLKFPQTTSISSRKDALLQKKVKEKELKQTKALLYAEKNKGDFYDSSPPKVMAESSTKDASEDNIIQIKSPRQCTLNEKTEVGLSSSTSQEDSTSDENDEWNLPLRLERKLSEKAETLILTLPSKKLPSLLAGTSTVTKTSIRSELKTVSTILKAGGADISDASCSVATIHRQRKASVNSRATEIRKNIKDFKGIKARENGSFLVLHWDGKIIQLLTGETEDRLAIAISSPNHIAGQFVASPAIPDGTGETMANCVFQKVSEFDLLDDVQAVVFDTTASNTGRWKGSVTRFEIMLNRSILWLACRHHIPELHIKHANEEIRGPSKGPDDPLFKEFKKQFQSIDTENLTLWEWPDNVQDWRHQKADEVLIWADYHMQHATWPREDYRELLELVVTYLGGAVKRVQKNNVVQIGVTIRKPGAIHRARFMASCLYLLKICLLQMEFDTPQLQDALILGEYIALLHAPYFLKCPLAASAPRHDRDFFIDLCTYKGCFDANSKQHIMIEAVQESVRNHLWYLTAELVVFAIFDDGLDNCERKAVATKLLNCVRPDMFNPGKPHFPTELMAADGAPRLDSFVNERSWLLFDILETGGEWLSDEVAEWATNNEYIHMQTCLRDLKVVNDVAERCIKDIQEYADVAKDSQYQEDILIVATDHRGIFKDLRKQALR